MKSTALLNCVSRLQQMRNTRVMKHTIPGGSEPTYFRSRMTSSYLCLRKIPLETAYAIDRKKKKKKGLLMARLEAERPVMILL